MSFAKPYSPKDLILVDDVWDASAWDDFVGCFQDANNGSRIILTTRNHEVATYAKFQSEPLPLRMFNDNESWDLLRKKVFGEKNCFLSLLNIGKLIAKKCGGLPLSVALVAGILAGVEKREECWEQVANNLGTYIHNDSRAIIEHSYQNLPYHLRSCFLYFGAFLEDKVIHVSKLIQLWISEAFIISCEGKSLEDIAEGYLENLVERNLVMLTQKSYGGKIEGCRIHDLLHDFCKERAKEENFLVWIKRDHNANPSSSAYCYKPFAYRMFISRPHIGSIILFNGPAFDFSHKLQNFKFLKVLDLELTRINFFPTDLVCLRYFAAKSLASRIPSSLPYSNWNLETFILHKYPEKELPVTLYEMLKLRHLHIDDCRFTTENEEEFLENSKSLYNLTSLSCPCFSSVHDLELILGKTPNLRELYFKIETIPYNFQHYVLNFSSQIETLNISHVFGSAVIFPFCISAPNLKNLTLDQFVMFPPNLSNIASLQKLQFLKLSKIEFVNGIWEVSNGEFPELQVLELKRLGSTFNEWNISEDAFCKLEHLVLWGCEYMKEVPSCFGDMFSLKSIEVNYCNKFVNQSVREIRELQVEEYQNTGFEVFIKER